MKKLRYALSYIGISSVPLMMLLAYYGSVSWWWIFAPLVGVFIVNANIAMLEANSDGSW